jgi:adenylate cyclase
MTAAVVGCGSCGTELPPNSKFCKECGAAVATATTPAEYKQVTVLFVDVVHSMDIAGPYCIPGICFFPTAATPEPDR